MPFSTTDPMDCDSRGECGYCTNCATNSICAEQWNACQAAPDCALLFECLSACADDPVCQEDCYAEYPGAYELFSVFAYCLQCTACFNSCNQGGMTC
jgi:hypothetical protein